MNARALIVGAALAATAGVGFPIAQTPTSVDGLVSAAKRSAGTRMVGHVSPPVCRAAPGGRTRKGRCPRRTPRRPDRRPGATWYAEPAKVADNFYFLGTRIHNAWALVGSDGIIVFEALFDYAAPDEIADGMRKLGLDVNRVKYVVISHAHGDHDGGAKFLQDKMPKARLVYGGPDWDAVDKSTNRPGGKPKRDLVGDDGMKLTVGDASVQIVTTPGHTAGDAVVPFRSEGQRQAAARRLRRRHGDSVRRHAPAYYDGYIASVKKMAKAAADFGATVLLSNHTEFDNGYYKAHTAANRKPGEANPFDVGRDAVDRYFTVVEQCTTAAKLRAAGKP